MTDATLLGEENVTVPIPAMMAIRIAAPMIMAATRRRGSTDTGSFAFSPGSSGWGYEPRRPACRRIIGEASIEPALFLFDIDGTILRGSTAVHRDAFAHAYREVYGLPLSLDGIRAAGRTDTWLLAEPLRRHGLPDEDIWSRLPSAFECMQLYVEEHLGDLRGNVLPGVPEVLAELDRRGQFLGLLTGNLSRIAAAKMRAAGLARYFDVGGFGEESEIRSALVPVAISKAAQQAGRRIKPGDVVVIGDTPLDIEAGREAGTRTVGVATGPYSVGDLEECGADLALESLDDAHAAVDALMRLVHRPSGAGDAPLQ